MAKKKDKDQYFISYGVGYGILAGSLLGVVLNNLALFAAVGLGTGALVGIGLDLYKKRHE